MFFLTVLINKMKLLIGDGIKVCDKINAGEPAPTCRGVSLIIIEERLFQ
jgi:hypothetical protein